MDTIHHIAIQVDNIQQSLDWYTTQFDIKVVYQDDTWALLQFFNVSLALVLPQQHPGHFAIVSDHAERYGPLKIHRDGTASVYITDPTGNTIEMIKVSENES